MSSKRLITIGLLSCIVVALPGADIRFSLSNSTLLSTGSSQPLWFTANRDGYVPSDPVSTTTWFDARYAQLLTPSLSVEAAMAAGIAGTDAAITAQLREAWVSAQWRGLELKGGLFPFTRGFIPFEQLSSGSMSISGNAYPLPSIQISAPDFLSVPLTDDNVAVLGGISHGWFTGDGAVENHLLHEKWAYLRLGSPAGALSVHGGLIHQVIWAGTSDVLPDRSQPAPATFDNFVRVFSSSSGGGDASLSDQLNRLGDTKGIWDLGLSLRLEKMTLYSYYHHFFEDGSGFRWLNAFDGLVGVAVELDHNLPVIPVRFVREWVDTRYQSGELHDVTIDGTNYLLGGRDSYYVNGTYVNGWSHRDRILGNPLLILSGTGTDARIASNRVWSRHIGAEGFFTGSISYRVKITHVWHYPSYSSVSIVSDEDERLEQWHNLFEVEYQSPFGLESLRLTGAVGLDVGSVYDDAVGFGLSASYSF